ncbi:MAG: response regulator transcription factor, partial [Anaerolineae bacterium]
MTTEAKGCKVLVIDDEPEMGELIKLVLGRGRNDEVKCAVGGRQGLVVAEQDPQDLIILDIMMPDIHGYEVYERLSTAFRKFVPNLSGASAG